ncbi:EVE domain-containing protein [Rubrivirga sp. S365]|uniref:EVE domain-containing protein n=1 Tax=Rubrivirga sp. S365 TaxID=3076080 RepID=UPI0028C517FD|nr:EVE domain-containing protein [Rubrivirga sp. S365]MDT7855150.1 EVE domain-containing protein [Rubrivirga sp. S365]
MTYWLWSVPPDLYPAVVRTQTFALRQQGRKRLAEVRPGDHVFAYVPGSRVIAGQFEVVGEPFEDATALVPGRHAPHRVRVRPVVVLPEEAWVPYDGFARDLRVLDQYADVRPEARFRRVVQRVLHRLPPIDGKVLEFVVRARAGADPEALMAAVEAVREARDAAPPRPAAPPEGDRPESAAPPARGGVVAEPGVGYVAPSGFDRAEATERLIEALAARGFVFAPWEVAAYVTALRTKPLVLLAGVTGVGKSRLPALVAEATGGAAVVVPVRPDWTDPGETMGYTDLAGRFRPGAVLRAAWQASDHPARFWTLVLDEMNLGRPEHYLAEVLSRVEDRRPAPGGWESAPLLTDQLDVEEAAWQAVRLPPNLGIVGTVNVDESAHAFSRKVLDRAFVIELAARDLAAWDAAPPAPPAAEAWPASAWTPRAVRLGGAALSSDERAAVERTVAAVAEASAILDPAGLGVGYRARDEAALFVVHAGETPGAFRTDDGGGVDAVDVALLTKVLPRIDGARAPARAAVYALLAWAAGEPARPARDVVDEWAGAGRPSSLDGARFPRTAARLARIAEGALDDGVASFWA